MNSRSREAERETHELFVEQRRQQRQWFRLRLVIGYTAVVVLVCTFVLCCFIVLRSAEFPAAVVVGASTTLLGDVVGLAVAVWKDILNLRH